MFGSRKFTKWEKSGSSIEIGDDHLILDEEFSPHYNAKNDVVIRNYSSALTDKCVEHLRVPFNELTQKRLFYTNFCGIIEYVPPRILLKSPYKIGDKVWGIKASYKQQIKSSSAATNWLSKPHPFGHCNAWSDYICTDMRCLAHLPKNIPLEFGGLFGTDLLMIFDGFGRINWLRTKRKIQNKKVLIIGSGRQSLLNVLIPILQICGAAEICIASNHERHNKLLSRLNVQSIIDKNAISDSKHKQNHYDLIIDSLSTEQHQIESNVSMIDKDAFGKTEYWVIRNPYHSILQQSETRSEGKICFDLISIVRVCVF